MDNGQRGTAMPYDPANFDAFFAHEYGGFGGGHHMSQGGGGGGGGGRFPPGMNEGGRGGVGGGGRGAPQGVVRGRVPMPPGGFGRPMYANHHHQDGFMQQIGFPSRPPMGQGFGGPRGDPGFGHAGGRGGGKFADSGRFMGHGGGAAPVGFDIDEESTQVTIPKEVAGAIIGKSFILIQRRLI